MLIFGGPCGGLGQISGMLILWYANIVGPGNEEELGDRHWGC